jgi:hypothetical protein
MQILKESTESSSPIITRAVAAGLRGKAIDNYEFPLWQRIFLLALGLFPQIIARSAISRFQTLSGAPSSMLKNFSLDQLILSRLADYSGFPGGFQAVVLGAGLGGATTYLSLALKAPFLPQAFVITLNKGSLSGNVNEYANRSLDTALEIAQKDPRLMTIQHYDPVHDGWLTRYVNHLRFKLIDLPDAYADFIHKHIDPGGAVVFLDCEAEWLRYRVGVRSVFQVGGWGDLGAREYLESSFRIKEYASRAGFKNANWSLINPSWPLEIGPESEWGCEPGLADALEKFCGNEGYRFVRIRFPNPNDFSRLAFSAAKLLLEKDGRDPAGTLIECFSQFDSISALQSGLLPLWLIFNTTDSADYLKEMSVQFPANSPIFFSPLSTFLITPDMAPWGLWKDSIGRDFINIGTRESHYPSDSLALNGWAKPLRNWVRNNYKPIISRLTAEELALLARNITQADARSKFKSVGNLV